MPMEIFFLILAFLSACYGVFSVWNRGRMESEIIWFLLAGYFLLPWGFRKTLFPWYVYPLYLLPILVLAVSVAVLIYKNREYGREGEKISCSYAVILGCKVGSLAFHCREEKAYSYLLLNPACTAVCSGGQGKDEPISEAEAYILALVNRGIPEKRLIREDQSVSTAENLRNSLAFIPNPEEAVAVITQSYHITRSRMIAKKAGYQNPAMISAYSVPVHQPNYLLREVLAIVYGKLRGTL